ncbi:MAG: hypothetical protein ACD_65C00045G0002 [uncultured bacterium]|nr:MAG: hypothetical protein ACD_65C00045G0002 [uncultured bacterium]KKT02359.1 MAG: Addiction module toxin, RelE/StbE family [Candidatus Peregrinibacteria bacterium GW2011_GWF2_43_17]KKT20300.1 MAG: Addiction module toxin, RelE/StbE family [Candidatus Peregrinibacteria bacterium GW2011_GWA2_43_8]HAU39443.1 type II toxin-antitoxin system mRNA interferase toxin, RelE/StbE family [Candidatus Peregrinibacteria bacterium]
MILEFHKNFEKRYRKLDNKLKVKVDGAIKRFIANPYDPILRNHSLNGRLEGKRAFWAGGDLRVVFEEFDNYVLVVMLDVGTHNQVY